MKWTKLISSEPSFEFSGFYYTSNFLRIFRMLLHLKQLFHKTNQHKRLENLPFSRNLVTADRKRRGQGGVMWIKDHKRSDAKHIAWINLIQFNTIDCTKLGLMWVQKRCIDASSAQVTAPGLNGGFSFRGLKKLKWGNLSIHSTAQRKEHSKTEFGKKIDFRQTETFYRSKFSRATGVTLYLLKLSVGNLETKTIFCG